MEKEKKQSEKKKQELNTEHTYNKAVMHYNSFYAELIAIIGQYSQSDSWKQVAESFTTNWMSVEKASG